MLLFTSMFKMDPFWSVAISATCIKFLLIPTYRSTDFEVHRNWLAITHNLPLSKWYYEATSQWTLDYPPLFAWFEFALSQLAAYFDPKMLVISANGYSSANTILFQRLSVIVTDLFYFYACHEWCEIVPKLRAANRFNDKWFSPKILLAMLFLWNPGLLIVDHIHFQYNGILSGLMLLSLARMIEKRELQSAFWFAVLLNMKHIYLYVAPAYFIYLLRNFCFDRHLNFKTSNFIKLAVVVGGVTAFSFGPFILMGQLSQVISRLFPFKRGLSHAYWAPNFWAIYNGIDKALSVVLKRTGTASMTGGLVQEFQHQVLPSITPLITLLCVGLSMVPVLNQLWTRSHQLSSPMLFIRSVIICSFCSFLFGWHVHEKAILLILLPLTPLAMLTRSDAKLFLILSTVGNFSLFPLLHHAAETPTKVLLLLIYCIYIFKSLQEAHPRSKEKSSHPLSLPILDTLHTVYIIGLVFVQLYYSFGNALLGLDRKYPFLPLMLFSTYCSLGIIWCFWQFYSRVLRK